MENYVLGWHRYDRVAVAKSIIILFCTMGDMWDKKESVREKGRVKLMEQLKFMGEILNSFPHGNQ